ncbi:hypothetical protein AMATHDRAFT_64004 [Amanita thiersii Skay4041]|uniref:C2H2-type domain-containing protein n=1 Tax=Amanita thiersii Skay4041 TaxID=703135 RepID=A0A2A9NIA2_9AGAR|nr:hypothetical protein AMATHDRAFT_64004 [Amanita thiersii Skay4041]
MTAAAAQQDTPIYDTHSQAAAAAAAAANSNSDNSRHSEFEGVWSNSGASALQCPDSVIASADDLDAEGDADEELTNGLEGPSARLRCLQGREGDSAWCAPPADVDGTNALVHDSNSRPYTDEYGESEIDSLEDDDGYDENDDEFFPSPPQRRAYRQCQREGGQHKQRTSNRYPTYSSSHTTSSSSEYSSLSIAEGSSFQRTENTPHRPTYQTRRYHSSSASTPVTFLTLASGAESSSTATSTPTPATPSRRRSRAATSSLPIPVPVPHLTKKSRGRRVPTVSSLEDMNSGIGRRKGGHGKGARMYLCEVEGCGKCFARGEHLKRHVRSIHTYEKPHQCPYPQCGKFFSRHDNLGQHMRVHKDFVPSKDMIKQK